MALRDQLVFDIAWGRCVTSQGFIPTFLRPTPGALGYSLNGSWRLVKFATHQPRFLSNGSLLIEQGSINLCSHPQDLSNSAWIKGSRMRPYTDQVLGISDDYRADQIVVGGYTGNDAAQKITRSFVLNSGRDMIATVYLGLFDGYLGAEDYVQFSGNVVTPAKVMLASLLNPVPGCYIPINLQFKTLGTAPVNSGDEDAAQTVTFELFVKKSCTLNWAGLMLESGTIWTNLIEQDGACLSRAGDFLQYPKNPVESRESFVFYLRLDSWRGDGRIAEMANFKVNIVGGKLEVNCGGTICTDPDLLPSSAQIAIWVSRGLGQVRLYINKALKATAAITNYLPTRSALTICGDGARIFNCLYFFRGDIQDGGKTVGQTAAGDLGSLYDTDQLITEQSQGNSIVTQPMVLIMPGRRAFIRFPGNRTVTQTISAIATSGSDVAKVVRVTTKTIVNAAASQVDWIVINSTKFEHQSTDTPTLAKIAADFAIIINTEPKYEKVNATYTASNAYLDITSATAGNDFYCGVNDRLDATITVQNATAKRVFTVQSAVDFSVGLARIERYYATIMEIEIESIDTTNNLLTCKVPLASEVATIYPGDLIIQEDWQLNCGSNNYFAHHLENHADIKIPPDGKLIDGVIYTNEGNADRLVTPYLKFMF